MFPVDPDKDILLPAVKDNTPVLPTVTSPVGLLTDIPGPADIESTTSITSLIEDIEVFLVLFPSLESDINTRSPASAAVLIGYVYIIAIGIFFNLF
jgi:hypothetical protein